MGKTVTDSPAAARQRTVLFSLCFDILLWIPEIIVVVLSGSVTMFADVLKGGNELLATFFALVVIYIMSRGAQFKYDYGMGKFETITRALTGGVMLISIFIIFVTAVHRLFAPTSVGSAGAFIGIPLMIITAVTDGYLWKKNFGISQTDPSPIMEAQWRLRRAKTFADIAVLGSLALTFTLMGIPQAEYIDPCVSFIIIGFLMIEGFHEISSSLPDLFDVTLEEELQLLILRELTSVFTEYTEFHGVRSRRSGSRVYIDIFLGFDSEKKMGEVQGFIDTLKVSLENQIPGSVVSIVPTQEQKKGN